MTAESPLAATLRLQLEAQCARAFNTLMRKHRPKCPVTLICCDYSSEDQPFQHMAYKSSVAPREDLIAMLEWYVERWADPMPPPVFHSNKRHGWLPDTDDLNTYAALVKRELKNGRAETGFALLCGKAWRSQYIATIERDDVAKLFRDDMIPWLSSGVASSSHAL